MGFTKDALVSRNRWAILAIFAILLALLIGLSGSSDAAVEGDYEYSVSGGNATITGYTGTGGDITIPATLGSNPVVSIDEGAFKGNTTLTSVSIPASVTSLYSSVFEGCTGLVTVTFHNESAITNLPGSAFKGCTALKNINIPDTVESIGTESSGSTFEGCTSLITISVPDAVTYIGKHTFKDCTSLESVTFSENSKLNRLGYGYNSLGAIFVGCSSLETVYLPKFVDAVITGSDFEGCVSLESFSVHPESVRYTTVDGALYYKNQSTGDPTGLYIYPAAKTGTTYTAPSTLNSIVSGAFQYSELVTIDLSGSVIETISGGIFNNCPDLTTIKLPDTVDEIISTAFDGCDTLTTIIVDEDSDYYRFTDGVLFDKDGRTLVRYPMGKTGTEYTIPNTVKVIADHAFMDCESLTKIDMNCADGNLSIGEKAFSGCSALETITLPSAVGRITIGNDAFDGCADGLTVFTPTRDGCGEMIAYTGSDFTDACNDISAYTGTLHLAWHYAPYWVNFDSSGNVAIVKYDDTTVKQLNIPSKIGGKDVIELGYRLFADYKSLETVTVPNTVSSFRESVFEDCTSLKNVTLSTSLTAISDDTFNGCSALETIVLPGSIEEIGDRAFMNTALKSIAIPNSVRQIHQFAFYNCTALKTATIDKANSHLYYLDEGAFKNCYVLDGITLPADMGHVGAHAFENCKSLTSFTIPNTYRIDTGLLNGCISLKTLVISEGCVYIESDAFNGCSSLTELNIPRNIAEIESYSAYTGLRSLTAVNVETGNSRYYSIGGVMYENYGGGIYLTLYPSNKTGDTYTMPDNVEYIRSCAILNNPHIKTWILSKSLNHDAEGLLPQGCYNLESIQISTKNQYYHSESGVLYNKEKTMLLCYPASRPGSDYTVLEDTVSIGYCSMQDTRNLENVILPDSVEYIIVGAFQGGLKLKTVTIGSGLKEIEGAAFDDCDNIESIFMSIPNSGRYIDVMPDQQSLMSDSNIIKLKDGSGSIKIEYNYVHEDEGYKIKYSLVQSVYRVAFDANGGDGYMVPMSFEMSESKALAFNTFIRPLYSFDSWNTEANGRGTTYYDGDEVSGLTTTANATVVLYAQWEPASYWVNFDPNEGYGEMESQVLEHSVAEALNENMYARDGWKFTGWNTESDGSGRPFADKEVIVDAINPSGYDVTLYAQWVEPEKYVIQFLKYDGGVFEKYILNKDDTIVKPLDTPTAPEHSDYEFYTWTGYVDGMKATSNMTFYPVYIFTPTVVEEPVDGEVEFDASGDIVDISNIIVDLNMEFDSGTIQNITMQFDQGTIGMGSDAFGSINTDGSAGIVPVSTTEVPSSISAKTSGRPVYDVFVGGIHEFDGKLTISFKYELGEGESAENLRIWHFDSAGNYVEEACTYDSAKGEITFTTDNLSYFAIMHSTAGPGNGPDGGSDDDGDGGMSIGLIIGIIVGVLAVAGVGVFIFLRKKA